MKVVHRMAIAFRFLYFLGYVPVLHNQPEINTREAGMPRNVIRIGTNNSRRQQKEQKRCNSPALGLPLGVAPGGSETSLVKVPRNAQLEYLRLVRLIP